MTAALDLIGALLLVPLALIDAVFLTELVVGLLPGRARPLPAGPLPRIALLVPAHDEAPAIRAHVAALRAVSPPGTRLLVVADNCTDDTAAEARAGGAEVVERRDPLRRGKGYALAFGRDRLAADPPDVALVVDADCMLEPGAVERLARTAASTGRPVQGAYLFRPQRHAPPMVQVSNFAVAVKNLVRQRGGRRIGAAAILGGTGMAFPWRLFATLPLATGHVVEDLALGIDLVRLGAPPLFEEGARLWSDPSSAEGTRTQRARWEGGFLAVARGEALPLVAEGARRRRWAMWWLGLHLLVPPLALLVLLNVLLTGLLVLLALAGMAPALVIAAGLLLLLLGVGVLAAWVAVGRDQLPAARLLRLPLYVAWKAALHLRLVTGRERAAWVRTERVDREG